MGFADLPVEFLRALHIKPSEKSSMETRSEGAAHSRMKKPLGPSEVKDLHTSPPSSQASNENDSSTHSVRKSPSTSSQNLDQTDSTHNGTSLNPSLSQQPSASHLSWKSGASMAQTLSGSPSRRSRSSSRDRSSLDSSTSKSIAERQRISLETAVGTSKGIGRIVGAGLKSPMDFTLSLARGFHNAPRLYGDESVRHPDKVTGIQSGLRTAGKVRARRTVDIYTCTNAGQEFGYGVYDGVTGLFTQPIEGAKQEGMAGFVKGFGKGIGGFFLKPSAGMCSYPTQDVVTILIPLAFMSLPAYTFSGIYKELQKHFGSSVQNYVVAARLAQGYEDLAASTEQQRLDAVKRWQATQVELHKEKEQLSHCGSHQHWVFLRVKNAAHASLEGKKNTKNGKLQKTPRLPKHGSSAPKKQKDMTSLFQQSAFISDLGHTTSATFEEAIQQSVQATSHGNPEEDAMIERAIRASVTELRTATKNGDEEEAIQRAIQASVAEATRARKAMVSGHDYTPAVQNDGLQQALQRSISLSNDQGNSIEGDEDDSGVGTDDDENIKTAIERSKSDYQRLQDVEKHLPREEGYPHRARTEEEIVLEYVKKQSLLEEEHRRSLESKAGAVPRTSGDTV